MKVLFTFLTFLLVANVNAKLVQNNGPYGGFGRAFAITSSGIGDTSVYAGTDGGVFRSTNNGSSWTEISATSTITRITKDRSLAVSFNEAGGTNIFVGTHANGIFLSTNNSESWTQVNTGLTNLNIYALATSGTNVFAGTYGGGVILSTNNGASWTPFNTGLSSLHVISLTISADNLFAGTENGGVWRRPLSQITAVEGQAAGVSAEFSLGQNYPNPFNPSTKITWQSPVSGYTTLKVYDVLGNEVATLVNEYINAGSYEVEFNAGQTRNLSSGVYFYKLQVGEFVQTKKMILIK
ncbi:MAG: T9SS type A sorting domain-containing protein [Ignavibacteria bacterium]|nr:T9SS type A sorting domain-containing protein [Ignavibacteria bacterium]